VLVAAGQAAQAQLSDAEKAQTVESLCRELRARYVFPDVADKAAKELQVQLKVGAYIDAKSGTELATKLTADLNSVCHDAHLRVRYSAEKQPERRDAAVPTAEEVKAYKEMIRRTNAGFQKVERLPGNIGYFEFTNFMDPGDAERPIQATMDFLSDTDALIIDLRRNGGGSPETVRLLCSYLFDTKPVHLNDLYFRETKKLTEFWTLPKVKGKRYLNKDVYVLTSKRTGSGAEEFSYNLQNLKRATLIGEVTWGGANPGDVIRLNDHFNVFVPSGRAINPYTKTNWEGTGVKPDIAVPAEQALTEAHVMALKKLREKAKTDDELKMIDTVIDQVQAGKKT